MAIPWSVLERLLDLIAPELLVRRRLRFTVHRAAFMRSGRQAFFLNATNLSKDREIELTHVWLASSPPIAALQAERPLPQRLKPDETWETWIYADEVPIDLHSPQLPSYECLPFVDPTQYHAARRGMQMPKTSIKSLTANRLRELAHTGAEVTLKRLRAEIIAIERTFPELALPQGQRALRRSFKEASKRTRMMSAAARKAVSARMKRYWAERRKAQAKVR